MSELIQLYEYPVNNVLKYLLADKTTKKNIIFATDAYSSSDLNITKNNHMTPELLKGSPSCILHPRVCKTTDEQSKRTKNKAEVFTPSWICNKMNNYCDTEWFGRENVFNTDDGEKWTTTPCPIQFDKKKTWQKYVDSRRIEITCGEAPFIVSRYDASDGSPIRIEDRIGILDRKLRVVNENTTTEDAWIKWVFRAYESVYGYEFQGDNLLIARINLLTTFVEYMDARWNRKPTDDELKKITNIICWNFWQMDGLTGSIPYGKPREDSLQSSLFDFVVETVRTQEKKEENGIDCKIYDWRSGTSIRFISLKEGK